MKRCKTLCETSNSDGLVVQQRYAIIMIITAYLSNLSINTINCYIIRVSSIFSLKSIIQTLKIIQNCKKEFSHLKKLFEMEYDSFHFSLTLLGDFSRPGLAHRSERVGKWCCHQTAWKTATRPLHLHFADHHLLVLRWSYLRPEGTHQQPRQQHKVHKHQDAWEDTAGARAIRRSLQYPRIVFSASE